MSLGGRDRRERMLSSNILSKTGQENPPAFDRKLGHGFQSVYMLTYHYLLSSKVARLYRIKRHRGRSFCSDVDFRLILVNEHHAGASPTGNPRRNSSVLIWESSSNCP